jgi:cellulose synthase/poly-beta-1,6-N-acetylglucosamine synthase-like glycosyltransferase
MTLAIEALFWVSLSGVVYAYAGYPLLLMGMKKYHNRELGGGIAATAAPHEPTVSILIPMFNEADVIGAKLSNTLELDYPQEKLQVIVISDGSTDSSAAQVQACAPRGVKLAALPERQGKAAALNLGLSRATHEIVVFSDASILLSKDAIKQIVLPFVNPDVGCVSGEDRIDGSGGEGFYGRYELFLRRLESKVGSIVGASGCFYAQRRALCSPFPQGLAPDFLSVLCTVEMGFRAVTAPAAVGHMSSLSNPRDEFSRKVRTVLRGMTTLFEKRNLLNPFRHSIFSLELLSHKVLRWLVPVLLILTFAANLVLIKFPFFRATLGAQAVFYMLALIGALSGESVRDLPCFRIPLYFTIANAASLVAWLRYSRGVRQEIWAPSRRS